MRVLVTGATGFVGRNVCSTLSQAGYDVVALSRDPDAARLRLPQVSAVHQWSPREGPPPSEAFAGVDAVINLMGENVFGRWTPAKKERIYQSRVFGTRNLVAGMRDLSQRPSVLISQSAHGYYGDRGEEELTESAPPGDIFLSQVCKDWEAAASEAEELGVRVVCPRPGFIVGGTGSFLGPMLPLYKLGLGGPLGSGDQWWSWVHVDDLVRLYIQAIENDDVRGPLNAVTTEPVRQRDFAKALGRVLRRPALVPAPTFALRLVFGEFSTEILTSKRLVPKAMLEKLNFAFTFPQLGPALRDALQHMR